MTSPDPWLPRPLPPLASQALDAVTNTLALWLVTGAGSDVVRRWGESEWLAVESIAYWQGAVPWLVQRLAETGIAAPSEIQTRLERISSLSRQRTEQMLRRAAALLLALSKEGIQALPLKGALLVPQIYADPLLRPLGDVDLLVKPRDVRRTANVLLSLGYTFFKRSNKDETYLIGSRKKNVWAPDNVHPVEVHHHVVCEFAGFTYDLTQELWAAAGEQPFWQGQLCQEQTCQGHTCQEQTCVAPSRPTLFLHVAAHAAADMVLGQGKLMQLMDLCALAQHLSPANWQQVEQALDARNARFIYPAVTVAMQAGAGPFPQPLLEKLHRLSPPALQDWAAQVKPASVFQLAGDESVQREYDSRIARLFTCSATERFRLGLNLAFPPRWHSRLEAYPRLVESPFWPLAYLLLNGKRLRRLVETRFKRLTSLRRTTS